MLWLMRLGPRVRCRPSRRHDLGARQRDQHGGLPQVRSGADTDWASYRSNQSPSARESLNGTGNGTGAAEGGTRRHRRNGQRLNGLATHGFRVLRDRRIPVSPVITSARHAQRLR